MAILLPLVAVVEDDAATLRAFGRVLRAAGFEAAMYDSAEDYLASPPDRAPTCLVVDVQLGQFGRLSGLDLQRRLQAAGSTIPIIVMTAFDDPRVRAEAHRIGCAAFFDKRADIDDLLTLVRTLQAAGDSA